MIYYPYDVRLLRAKVREMEEQKIRAEAALAAEKEADKKALEFWKIEAETAKAAVANAVIYKRAFEAALVTEMHELKRESKALTTTIAPLQAAIVDLTATIARLQSDRATSSYPSWDSAYDHHDQTGNASEKEPVQDESISGAKGRCSYSRDRFEMEDRGEEDAQHACENTIESKGDNDADVEADYCDNWDKSLARYSSDGWGSTSHLAHNMDGNDDADMPATVHNEDDKDDDETGTEVQVDTWERWGTSPAGNSSDGWGSTSNTHHKEDGNNDTDVADSEVDVGHWERWEPSPAGYTDDAWGSTSNTNHNEDGNNDAREADNSVSDKDSANHDS